MFKQKNFSILTAFIFALTLCAGVAVDADEHKMDEKGEPKHEKYDRHDKHEKHDEKYRHHDDYDDKDNYRDKYKKYNYKYKKYKHKYYRTKHKYKMYKKKYYHEKHRDKYRMKKFWKSVKSLELTGNVKSAVYELKYDWKIEKIDLKSAVKKAKIRLHRLKKQDDATTSQLNERIDALYEAKAEYKKGFYGFKMDVKSELSSKQLEKLKSRMKKDHDDKNHHGKKDDDDDKKRHETDDHKEKESYFF
jgi:hypothetical protein